MTIIWIGLYRKIIRKTYSYQDEVCIMSKTHMEKYIVGAVLVVAIIGVLSLLMTGVSNNLTGQAIGDPLCTDTDGPVGAGGLVYTTQGTISGGTWKTTGAVYADKTDSCVTSGRKAGMLLEGFCPDSTHGFYNYVDCATKVGAGYRCVSGACVLDSDADGVTDASDVCPGYDDAADADSDGTPDGCETVTDSDSDGVADADDVCDGYDDAVNTDSDTVPDGCDDDDDGDGYSDADETAAGTDSLDATDYPVSYPDLTHDEDSTSMQSFEGDVYYIGSEVVGYDIDGTLSCGIRNDGTTTATEAHGKSYTYCYLYDDSMGTYYSPSQRISLSSLASGEVYSWEYTFSSSGTTGLWNGILQEIYDGGGDVYIKYDIDDSTVYYITESDESEIRCEGE